MATFQNNKRELLKEKCLEHLGGKICAKCRNNGLPICCYDFHHIKGNKDGEISKMFNKPWNKIKEELSKCIVVCKNCHAEIHYFNLKIW
jgi:hypothetical protein